MSESYPLPPRLAEIAADLPSVLIAFAPVPVRPRRNGWTAERQRGFILRLALSGCIAASAQAVGMSRRTAYRLRDHPGGAGFAAAWDAALRIGVDTRKDFALERAVAGEVRPVFYRGRKVGEQVHFDAGLTIAVLRARSTAPSHDEARLILNDFLGKSAGPS